MATIIGPPMEVPVLIGLASVAVAAYYARTTAPDVARARDAGPLTPACVLEGPSPIRHLPHAARGIHHDGAACAVASLHSR